MKKFSYILLFLLSFFMIIIPVKALVNTSERVEDDNYGVNKKWKITSSNKANILNTPLVDSSEKVYDFADILDSDEELELRENIEKFIDKTNMDMVILTINEPYSYDSKNEDIAADFYDYNDFGLDFPNYSGILILRNTYAQDPYYDIYTFGDAQIYFNFNRLDNTLDYIYNDLHNGYYLDGFNSFISKISAYYDDGIPNSMKNAYIDEDGAVQYKRVYNPPILVACVVGIGVALTITLIFVFKNKMVKKATKASEYLVKDSVNFTLRKDDFRNSVTTHYTVSSSSSGGGGHSSFGSSGGGHSSGGGRHG